MHKFVSLFFILFSAHAALGHGSVKVTASAQTSERTSDDKLNTSPETAEPSCGCCKG